MAFEEIVKQIIEDTNIASLSLFMAANSSEENTLA